MVWREYVERLAPPAEDGGPRFRPAGPPATEAQLAELERDLGVALPADLRSLLLEMDGVWDEPAYLQLVLPVAGIAGENHGMREIVWPHRKPHKPPFDHMLFFAQAGNGDLFAFPIETGVVRDDTVIDWNHEIDETNPIASSLAGFLRWWATTRKWT